MRRSTCLDVGCTAVGIDSGEDPFIAVWRRTTGYRSKVDVDADSSWKDWCRWSCVEKLVGKFKDERSVSVGSYRRARCFIREGCV